MGCYSILHICLKDHIQYFLGLTYKNKIKKYEQTPKTQQNRFTKTPKPTTVLPRIESPGLYLILGVESGDSIRGGFNRGEVNKLIINKFLTLFKQKCVFLCCLVMKYSLYCLLNM